MSSGVVKPMLAKDGDLSKITYPVIVQPKLDGIRCLVVDGVARSRTFKPIPNAEIQAALGRPEFNGLDGEIIVGDATAEGCMQRSTSFVMAPNKTGEGWRFFVFDRWDNPHGTIDRLLSICEYRNSRIEYGGMHLYTVPKISDQRVVGLGGITVATASDLEAYEGRMLAHGHEGIIVRSYDAPYKHGRSGVKGPLLKVKRFIDFEAEVIGVYEEMHNANEAKQDAFGRTERSTVKANKHGKGTLGGFELRAINGPHEGDVFRCGTGFTREQREALWLEAGDDGSTTLNGAVVKIKSFPIGVKDLPRFPVFLGFRDMEIDG